MSSPDQRSGGGVERRVRFVVVQPGGRLDKALLDPIPEVSRSRLQGFIRQGRVTVDGRVVAKPGFKLEGGEVVEIVIPPPRPTDLRPEAIPLEVVFENADVLVVNKPAGMVVHPSAGHESGTLVHAALAHAKDLRGIGGEIRPGVVHRLDKDTSGLVVLAKNEPALHLLQRQFKARRVEKSYLALVDGAPPTPVGRIEVAIGRDLRDRKRMSALPEGRGRQATTTYRRLEAFAEHTLLEVHPLTGRTHQIRVHLAYLGCPVVGDRVYGRRKPTIALERHFLHAFRLTLRLPGEDEPRLLEARLPEDLEAALALLRARG